MSKKKLSICCSRLITYNHMKNPKSIHEDTKYKCNERDYQAKLKHSLKKHSKILFTKASSTNAMNVITKQQKRVV